MKSLFQYLGSLVIAALNVSQMKSFNPFTLIFWATLTGIIVWSILGALAAMVLFDVIEKLKNKWIGAGKIHSKGLSPQR